MQWTEMTVLSGRFYDSSWVYKCR